MMIKRRDFLLAGGVASLAACNAQTSNYFAIDQHARNAVNQLTVRAPDAQPLLENAAGYIVVPDVIKAGLIWGGSRGRGTMFTRGNVTGHYAITAVSWGFQAGVAAYSLVLVFHTPEALAKFRSSPGFEIGSDIEYALPSADGFSLGASSATFDKSVLAIVFNQQGLLAGASLEGAKWSAY